jgi:hypothetical protein
MSKNLSSRVANRSSSMDTDITFINNVPKTLRVESALSIFPDLGRLREHVDIECAYYNELLHLSVSVGKSEVNIAFDLLMGPDMRIINLPYSAGRIIYWSSVSTIDETHGYEIIPECLGEPRFLCLSFRNTDPNIQSHPEFQCNNTCDCKSCRDKEFQSLELRHNVEKIDHCINYVSTGDILSGLMTLRERYTLLCIWTLRWDETMLPQVPREVLGLIMGKI